MRLLRVTLLLLALGVLVPAGAQAASGYCSPTGDYCYSATKRQGVVRLTLGTFSFRGGVEICVTAPDRSRSCKTFTLRTRPRGVHEVDARWSAHFPRKGAGTYRVTFAVAGSPAFRPSVTFAVRG
jgi:hypothetical protein